MTIVGLLFESTIKASLVMLAALAIVACLRRQSAALRHWILSAAIVAVTAAPAVSLVTPSWHVPLDAIARPGFGVIGAPPAAVDLPARPAGVTDPPRIVKDASPAAAGALIATTWMAGAAVSMLILVIGMSRLAWVASSARRVVSGRWAAAAEEIAQEYGLRRPVVLLQSQHPALLVTWGFAQPKVILPREAQ